MKSLLTGLSLLIAGLLSAQTYTVEVQIKNVRSDDGVISAALYDNADDFPTKENAYMGIKTEAQENMTLIRFENVPAGKYAMAVLHDENKNDEMDTNFLGIPQEGYCFSNNARARFGAPKFDKAAFRVKGDLYTTLFIKY